MKKETYYYIGGGALVAVLLYLLFRPKYANSSGHSDLFDSLDHSVNNPSLKGGAYMKKEYLYNVSDEVKLLQSVINAKLKAKESKRTPLKVDGMFGPKTAGALMEVYGFSYFETKADFEKFTALIP